MRTVKVEYLGRLQSAAGGLSQEDVSVDDATTPLDVLQELATRHGASFESVVTQVSGRSHSNILLFADGKPIQPTDDIGSQDVHSLLLMTMSGGG